MYVDFVVGDTTSVLDPLAWILDILDIEFLAC